MMAILFSIILTLLQVSAVGAVDGCTDIKNDCEYYSCVSEAKHCPQSSYLMRFGHKYCLRYEYRSSSFSAKGMKWIDDVRSCLIRKMNTYPETLSCMEFKKFAFRDHVPCYLESGFCELSKSDRIEVLKTIWPSLVHLRIVSHGYRVYQACSNKN